MRGLGGASRFDRRCGVAVISDHNRLLVGYLTSRLRSEQEAKEVAQEAYVRLLQLQDPGTSSLLRAYLFKTATNLAIDRLRHRRVERQAEAQPELFDNLTATGSELEDPAKNSWSASKPPGFSAF